MHYKNDNTTFLRRSAVSGSLAFESDVTAVLTCEKLIDNFACLKARKKFHDRLWTVGYVDGKIWHQLMQIIIYVPTLHGYNCLCWWGLPVVTVSYVLYRKTHSSAGVARQFDWGNHWPKTRTTRFAHEFKKIFTKWSHFATMTHVSPLITPLFYRMPFCTVVFYSKVEFQSFKNFIT